jgi:hypothetical protein
MRQLRTKWYRDGLQGLVLLLLFVCLPASSADLPAWSDRAMRSHVDLSSYSDTLDSAQLNKLINAGDALFRARFTTADGVGRPMATQAIIPTKRKRAPRNAFARTAGIDANACSSCHNVPVIGGAGDFSANVFVSEGFQQADFDTTDAQFSNERNTNHLFGAGLIELLAREMTTELQLQRSQALQQARASGEAIAVTLHAKGIAFGKLTAHADGQVDTRALDGIDTDLVIRPFSQKGVMTSLRQFTVNALNQHHGMQAEERFGARWTGTADFDEDDISAEISPGDVSALVAWQATLPPPTVADDLPPAWLAAATRGSRHFDTLNCASCHQRSLPLNSLVFSDPGPLDTAGTLRRDETLSATNLQYDLALRDWAKSLPRDAQGRVLVPLFGDLKRHVIADVRVAALGNELLSQRFVERNVFMTSELWGIGSTAPYGHRGDMTTLAEVIAAHGGAARESRDAYLLLSESKRSDINAFLKSLVIRP